MNDFQSAIYIYGPQTVGKSTHLLKIIKHDRGRDLAFSGEDNFIDNGKLRARVTAPLPKVSNFSNIHRFQKTVQLTAHQYPIKHILIDGAQFISTYHLKRLQQFFTKQEPGIPTVFSGCQYYLNDGHHKDTIIPSSHFLLAHCGKTIPIQHQCDFCHQNATRFWARKIKIRTDHTIITQDPHLVCEHHYQILNQTKN